jgi:hypothetical protein
LRFASEPSNDNPALGPPEQPCADSENEEDDSEAVAGVRVMATVKLTQSGCELFASQKDLCI